MLTIHTPGLQPTNVKPTSPKLSKQDLSRLESGIAELYRLDNKMADLERLRSIRSVIEESARAFAKGQIDILLAVAVANVGHNDAAAVLTGLRQGCKSLQREIIADLSPLVRTHREHVVADLLGRCGEMEKLERQTVATIGIHADDYKPSGLLLALREQHLRARRDADGIITRHDLTKLAKACGVAIPSAPEADLEAEEISEGELAEVCHTGEAG